MKAADAALNAAQKQIEETESATEGLSRSLDEIGISNAKMQQARKNLQVLQDALSDTRGAAISTSAALSEVYLGPGQASLTALNARSEVNSLHDIRNAALEAAAAMGMLDAGPTQLMLGPGTARSMSQSMRSWAAAAERTDQGTFVRSMAAAMRQASADQPRDEQGRFVRSMSDAMREIDSMTARGSGGKFVSDTEAAAISARYLADSLDDARRSVEIFAAEETGNRLRLSPEGRVRDQGPYFGNLLKPIEVPPGGFGGGYGSGREPVDYHGGADLLPYDIVKAANDLIVANRIFTNDLANRYQMYTPGMGPETKEQYLARYATPVEGRRLIPIGGDIPPRPSYNFPPIGQGDVAGAKKFLKSRGINWDDTAIGGTGGVRRNDSNAQSTAAALGWSGRGSHWTRFGFGGRGFGWGIPVPPHARFGTPLAFAGFGLDRMIASSLGILGSFGGGILGGGILGAGALGTAAVGAGTNLAGMGQAAGDIKTVTGDLDKLQTAIEQYGKGSTQAAQAQLQLNTDLKGFSPVARQAVLAASQTALGFKAMFDKLTGPAEKIGAEIINQAMQVGEKFLPTIGKFARQNMGILQRGLQPFFSWLTKGGNAQNVIKDVNNLNKAIKEHGATSIQAIQANKQLNIDNRNTGGLAYFTDLEKVFQKHFPTAIHAGEQGFELFMKTIDLAAQHLGHFVKAMDNLFTRMNNQDFGKWASGVEKLIGLFHSWLGMFVAFGKVIFDVFKPAVGFGQAFAEGMTRLFNQIGKFLNRNGTQNILNQLFSVHLVQAIKQVGGLIANLMPIFENVVSAWLQIEIVIVKGFNQIVSVVRILVDALNKIPGADKLLGWAIAIGVVVKVNRLLLGSFLPILRSIPYIGKFFGEAASEATVATGIITDSITAASATIVAGVDRAALAVQNLIRQLMGIGPAAEESALVTDAAMASTTAEAGLLSRTSSRALGVVGLGGLKGGGFKNALGKAGLYAFGGYIASSLIKSIVPGKTGSVLGNVAKGAGIGAGIGMFVGMPEVGAAIGGVTGALVSLIHIAPSAGQQLKRLGSDYRALGAAAKQVKFGIVQARGQIAQDRQLRTEAQKQIEVARAHLHSAHGAQAQAKASQNLRIAEGNLAGIEAKLIQDEKALTDLREKGAAANKKQVQTQAQMVKSIKDVAKAQEQWVKTYDMSIGFFTTSTKIAAAAVPRFVQQMYQLSSSVQATNPKLAQAMRNVAALAQAIGKIPTTKTIDIIVRETFKGTYSVPRITRGRHGGPLPTGDGGGGSTTHHRQQSGPSIHLALPRSIQDMITKAEAGHGSTLKADKAAYDYYQKQLQQKGLTHNQRMKLYQAEAQYFNQAYGQSKPYQHGGARHVPNPTGYLDKQQAETARARIDINQGHYKAALKLLNLEEQQLKSMLKTAKTQAERTAILGQLSTVTGLIKSTKQKQTGVSPGSYEIPKALQLAMARADALAALNPNLQGPTAQQYKLAVKVKASAMKAINSHKLTMDALIQAWNVVGQANAVIAQRMGAFANTYHVVSTDSITDAVKGLTATQEMQLRERMAQRDAHRGYAPNQSAVGGGGSTVASPHHKHRHQHHQAPNPYNPGSGVHPPTPHGAATIHIDTVEVHGVQNVRQLAAELDKLARQKHQRAGGRR